MNSTDKIECSKCKGTFEKTQYRIKTKIVKEKEGDQTIEREKHVLCCPICGVDLKDTLIACFHCKAEFAVDKVMRRSKKKSLYLGFIGMLAGVALIGIIANLDGISGFVFVIIVIGIFVMMKKFSKKMEKMENACPVCKKELENI